MNQNLLLVNLTLQEREIRRINSDIEKQIKRDKREATRQYNTVQYSTIQYNKGSTK